MDLSDAVIVKSSRLKSVVWNDFDRVKKGDTFVAVCRHCEKKLNGSSTSGTSHLRNHLIRCQRRGSHGMPQYFSARDKKKEVALMKNMSTGGGGGGGGGAEPTREEELVGIANYKIEHGQQIGDGLVAFANTRLDQRRSQLDLARMIILHGYPLGMVEHVGFRVFVKNLQPLFELVASNRVEADCMEIYAREKQKVFELLNKSPGKISLGADLWAASDDAYYLCLTAHYIDEDWQLRKKILNFVMVDSSQTEDVYSEVIMNCLLDWDIDRKLFSITFDSYSPTDNVVHRIRDRLSQNRFLYCNGLLFDVRCAANTLNLMVHDALEAVCETTNKIRESIRQVRSSQASLSKFNEMALEAGVDSHKCLCLDNPLRWDSTYAMLAVALEYRGAFALLVQEEEHKPPTSSVTVMSLSSLEWERVAAITSHLKVFTRVTNAMLKAKCPTANIYFPEICDVHLELIEWCKSSDEVVRCTSMKMKRKFDEYWHKCCLALAVAAMLDPRFKMKLIEYYYSQLFGDGSLGLIGEVFEQIKALYKEHSVSLPLAVLEEEDYSACRANGDADSMADRLMGFDRFVNETSCKSHCVKADLDRYLEEPVFPRIADFDVLNWWKVHALKYPALSLMARNILASPMSKDTSDLAFGNRGRVLDDDWSSLQPATVQALMCCQDWMRGQVDQPWHLYSSMC